MLKRVYRRNRTTNYGTENLRIQKLPSKHPICKKSITQQESENLQKKRGKSCRSPQTKYMKIRNQLFKNYDENTIQQGQQKLGSPKRSTREVRNHSGMVIVLCRKQEAMETGPSTESMYKVKNLQQKKLMYPD